MKKIPFLLLIFISVYGCEKSPPVNKSSTLIGKWNWKTTTGGLTGSTFTPESTGKNILIEFTGDSIYRQYQNNSLSLECSFHTFSDTCESQLDDNLILFENHSTFDHYSVINYNTLFLSDKMPDGYTSEYVRIN